MSNSAVSFKAMRRISTPIIVVMILALCASLLISQFWWVVLLAGGIVTAASFFLRKGQDGVLVEQGLSSRKGGGMASYRFVMPTGWKPEEIKAEARKLRGDISVRAFARSFFEHFVVDQNTQTAQARVEFLKTILEEMKVSVGINDLAAEAGFWEGNDLHKLRRQRDTLKIEVEIAELKKQREEIQNPPKKETARPSQETRSAEEIRKEKREKIMKDIRDYEQRKRHMQADTTLSEDSRRRQENIIEKKIEQLHDELEKYI